MIPCAWLADLVVLSACYRCRSQKIRCDNGQDDCTNCVRAGQPCVRSSPATNPDAIGRIYDLESRLRSLERSISQPAPSHATAGVAMPSAGPPDSDIISSGSSPDPAYLPPLPVLDPQSGHLTGPWPDRGALAEIHQRHSSFDPLLQSNAAGVLPPRRPPVNETVPNSVSPATTTQITPREPLAHHVGLLSLANSKESKYLGPSSGVPFARLIFSAIPHSQGLPQNQATPRGGIASHHNTQPDPFPADFTFNEVDLKHFVDTYFETFQPLYPFLDEDVVICRLEALYPEQQANGQSAQLPRIADFESSMSPVHSTQLFLILALGARVLEPRLSVDFCSERYLATAMSRIDRISLHESMEGLQVMLLLTLCSFHFVEGPNAWFLVSNIIAACLDLGFQRKRTEAGPSVPQSHEYSEAAANQNVRKGIFWSAYTLERTLAVVLGRPLTLRDEAIDVEFPGVTESPYVQPNASGGSMSAEDARPAKRPRADTSSPYTVAQHSFRFDELTGEIKLMLYRVRNKPGCFPWLADVAAWQRDAHQRCQALVDDMLGDLKWRSRRSGSDSITRTLELKYHHCLMLLHRPSPAIPQPSMESWRVCYHSAVKTILISTDLSRFSKLNNSWLTAHTIFVSGMTFLYCLWVKPEIKRETSLAVYHRHAAACTDLLRLLGKTWSAAASALETFERLVHLTAVSWNGSEVLAAGHSLARMSQAHQGQESSSTGFPLNMEPPSSGFLMDGGNEYGFEPQLFFNELGDMSTWFDLDWMVADIG